MANKIKLYRLRWTSKYYRWLIRYYDALLMTWHKDAAIAFIAIVVLLGSLLMAMGAVWWLSKAIAFYLAGNISDVVLYLLFSAMMALLAKLGLDVSENLLPIRKAGTEHEESGENRN